MQKKHSFTSEQVMTAMDFWFHSEMHGFKKPAKNHKSPPRTAVSSIVERASVASLFEYVQYSLHVFVYLPVIDIMIYSYLRLVCNQIND